MTLDDEYEKLLHSLKVIPPTVFHDGCRRPFGDADERCKTCGGPIETLLNNEGRNPMRCCWKCVSEA